MEDVLEEVGRCELLDVKKWEGWDDQDGRIWDLSKGYMNPIPEWWWILQPLLEAYTEI